MTPSTSRKIVSGLILPFLSLSATVIPAVNATGQVEQSNNSPTQLSSNQRSSPKNPDRVDLLPQLKKWGLSPRAQGGRGTCSVFTVVEAIEYARCKRHGSVPRLSIEFLNWSSNDVVDEHDDGSFFSDLWKGFQQHGICDEKQMPYRTKFEPDLRPSKVAIAEAKDRRHWELTMHWIKPWDPKCGLTAGQFREVKNTLSKRWPVCGGFLWPKKAKWVDGVLQMASRKDVRDGHSVLLIGFRDDPSQDGGGVFLMQNSGKGSTRYGAMSYEYVRAYMNDALWIGYDQDGRN